MTRFWLFALAALVVAGCSQDAPVGVPSAEKVILASGSATQRPVEDFLAAQGTYCIPDGGGCLLFVPPIENFLGWFDPVNGNAASVDYAGLANRWLEDTSGGGTSLGTAISGTVEERELPDGTAHVDVVLHVQNALTWVAGNFDFNGDLLFGERAPEVLSGGTPTVGDCQVQFEFTNTAPGAPLPDIMQLLIDPGPGQAILGARIRATILGELRAASGHPDGIPGKMNLKQTSAFVPGQGAVADGFPVEFVRLKAMGNPIR